MTSENDPIQFIVPVALIEVMAALLPLFEVETGCAVQVTTMLNPKVPGCEDVTRGRYDLAITNPIYAQQMVEVGTGAAETVRPFARAPLAFGALQRGDVAPAEDEHGIRRLLSDTGPIGITETGTSGTMFARLAARLGLEAALAERLIGLEGGEPMRALLAGNVALAALPLTNLAPVKGVEVRGICPLEWGVHIDLALVARCAVGPAQDLLDWLMAPERDAELLTLGGQRFAL